MKTYIRMASQPPVVLRLVSIQVIEHDVNLAVRISRHNLIHKVQKLAAAAARVVTGHYLTSGDIQGREKRGGSMPLVAMTEPVECLTVGQSKPALSAFQCLDGRFFVHTQHKRVFRRIQVQTDDIGSLGPELRVGADTPTAPPLEADIMLAQNTPDLVIADIAQCLGQQTAVPTGIAIRGRLVQSRENPLLRVRVIAGWLSRPDRVLQSLQSMPGKALPPLRDPSGSRLQSLRDLIR